VRLLQHLREQLAEHLPWPIGIGIRHRRTLHRRSAQMIEPRLVALHTGHDLPQACRSADLAVQQRNKMPLRAQLARQLVRPVLFNNGFKLIPRNVLQ
jgi:hypothetical protein